MDEKFFPNPYIYDDKTIAGMFHPEFPLSSKITEEREETCFLWKEIQKAENAFKNKKYFEYDIATDNIHAMLNVLHVEGFLTDQEFQDASNRYGLGIVVKNGVLKTDVEFFEEFYR